MSEERKLWIIKETNDLKSRLWWLKVANWLCEYPSFKNNLFFKLGLKTSKEFFKDELSEIKKLLDELNYQLDEINDQLDEYQQEFKNTLGEIIEENNLFFKRIDEYEEGENEKKLKNNLLQLLKVTQAFFQNFIEIMKDPHVKPERYPAEEPGYDEDAE